MPVCSKCGKPLADGLDACPECSVESPDPLIGTLIGERYRILALLGQGGMGSVYRAEHVVLKKELALKVLHPELSRLEDVARRFEREAQSASRLTHDAIILVTDFGRSASPLGNILFLVMELLQGQSLKDLLRERGRLPAPEALAIARQILSALVHAHAAGVVHRDLKPDNIQLIEKGGRRDFVKILDFGIAKLNEPAGTAEALTQAGMVFGTPEYISPEQAMGMPADGRADLYAVGVMLYEMLCGTRPFVSENKLEILSAHLTQKPRPPRQTAPEAGIPAALERIVLRALEKDRDARFASASEMLAALDALDRPSVTAPTGVLSPPPAVAPAARDLVALAAARLRALRSRPKLLAGVIGGPVLVLALVIALAGGSSRRGPTGRDGGVMAPPPPPRPVPAAVAAPLQRAQEAISRGDLTAARAILQGQLSSHPENGRVHLLFGHLLFAERQVREALDEYRQALKRDAGLRTDAALVANVRGLLDDKEHFTAAFGLMCDELPDRMVDDVVRFAVDGRTADVRQRARRAAARVGAGARLDWLKIYLGDLHQAKSCAEKHEAIVQLKQLGDPRAVPDLKRMYNARYGFFGRKVAHACVHAELGEAIEALSARSDGGAARSATP
jgi:serine/threonine-protein kinase